MKGRWSGMKYRTAREISSLWGVSERRVRLLCSEGRICGAEKLGRSWSIPEDAVKPVDTRMRSLSSLSGLAYDFASIDRTREYIDSFRPFPKASAASLREQLVLEWTYNSNAIEGNTLTLSETKVVLEGITVGGKTLVEHLEAVNHRDAIGFIEDLLRGDELLSEWNVRNIHALILKGIDSEHAGRYRNGNVLISGALHRPPPHFKVGDLMQRMMESYNGDWAAYHPVTRAVLLHGECVKIHPFTDGNGRTARLLLNFELMKWGYTPVIIRVGDRLRYYEVLDHAHTSGDYHPFISFVAGLLEESQKLYLSVLE